MRILLVVLALAFSLLSSYFTVHAASGVTIKTTQNLAELGIPCTQKSGTAIQNRVYECTIEGGGINAILALFGSSIKYFTYIVALIGVFMLVFSGIQYSISGFDEELKTKAKEHIIQIAAGLALLFLMGALLNSIAPWVYK